MTTKRIFDSEFIFSHLQDTTEVFLGLLRDSDGEYKYDGFLKGLRNKFDKVEARLRKAEEDGLIDELISRLTT
ncbi:MAG: hypothetical protein A2W52_00495 [Candidatus Taylorbacteria bacterium RIFCSPHIGHO2_02_49_25]|uniref:Uncharacterized protein n=1 Tax=Candidatus Taylorbacteria bacterium RIFCSPHIGHO2_02_49_25 TaxID=1802305 RepID=A0A1G2MF47_9BACT|nr:MAG: hypothetical protein UY62_C0037G0002 [Parcubacteria group bacterium GW2011_GWF2_50_9]OHA20268.1 MAG: hypothetical protein A2759_02685 [Candidatus Taylorbacteria bacterium RIFCSPHIGHO2_01_FULL_49_60]OHA22453.1 MAG: hypothetical protein A2W52_00495 [Candidatus Taylorbacteria bacterium RIFCSPHIGHO2_02_49_25]OHA37498.1 MAG: hypothetical protein A2W65_01540 [Candidatus Taylorbacteria bacterium RIFCSPLOWO2_02_50_13]OHA46189.1 MAG: hypothetical protein A3G61_04000 [Candidatus Taylorbacteria ba